MNKIYSKIWSTSLGALVVASEFARQSGKGGSKAAGSAKTIRRCALTMMLGFALAPSAYASICNGTFQAGQMPTAVSSALACGSVAAATGKNSTAIGNRATATANRATALGYNSQAQAKNSVALGNGSVASQANTVSVGKVGAERRVVNVADGQDAHDAVNKEQLDDAANTAAGNLENATRYFKANGKNDGSDDALAIGDNATAVGSASLALGTGSTATGSGTTAQGEYSTASGYDANALADNSVALGANSIADRANTVSVGSQGAERQITNVAAGTAGTDAVNVAQLDTATQYEAFGPHEGPGGGINGDFVPASATGLGAVAIGMNSTASGAFASAWGFMARATNGETTAVGDWSDVEGFGATGVGGSVNAFGDWSTALGAHATTPRDGATALGAGARGFAEEGVAIGHGAAVTVAEGGVAIGSWASVMPMAKNSVALGANSRAMRANVVSVGSSGNERQITNVAAGTESTDAVNMAQLEQATSTSSHYLAANGLGDGSDDALAIGDNATAVGSASLALGTGSTATGSGTTAQGEYSTASGYDASALADNSVALGANSIAHRANSVSVGSTGAERQITHVAAGTQDTDAVNLSQLKQTGLVDDNGNAMAAVTYDSGSDNGQVTLAGAHGTAIANVKAGTQADQAVNVKQLQSLASTIGGGISMDAGGMIGTPDFTIQGSHYFSVGDALGALDDAVSNTLDEMAGISGRVDSLSDKVAHQNGASTGSGKGMAVGRNSYARDSHDTAIGNDTQIHADGSTALGNAAAIDSSATNAVAIGADSHVSGASGTAVGQGAESTAQNAVALGAGSVADQASTVSVGNAKQQRRVTQVADGKNAHDAVNKEQLDSATKQAISTAQSYADNGDKVTLNDARTYTDSKIAGMVSSTDFNGFRDQVNQRFHTVNTRLDRVGAMNSALAGMTGAIAGAARTTNRVSAAAGGYHGQAAIAVGYSHTLPGNGSVLFGGSVAGGGEATGTVGVSFGW